MSRAASTAHSKPIVRQFESGENNSRHNHGAEHCRYIVTRSAQCRQSVHPE